MPLITAIAVFLGVMPFLFWYQTWFGRQLSDKNLAQYLNDDKHPRRTQHALAQLSQRMTRDDAAATQWYPRVVELSRHALPEIRQTAAWAMGQDNRHAPFREALARLLRDDDLLVRRNAALALVRFGDARGRAELVSTLRPLAVAAPSAGTLSLAVQSGQSVGTGTLLGRIVSGGHSVEVRSPYAGAVQAIMAPDNSAVSHGAEIARIGPNPEQVWESLRALYLVGEPDDLRDIERLSAASPEMPGRVRQQAVLTAQAIRARSTRTPSR